MWRGGDKRHDSELDVGGGEHKHLTTYFDSTTISKNRKDMEVSLISLLKWNRNEVHINRKCAVLTKKTTVPQANFQWWMGLYQLLTAANSFSCFGMKAVSTFPFLKSCQQGGIWKGNIDPISSRFKQNT